MDTSIAYRAGQLDTIFRHRSLATGSPYTTKGLLSDGRMALRITDAAMRNICGRAARFLSAEELAKWRSGVMAIKAQPDLAMQYDLGSLAAD